MHRVASSHGAAHDASTCCAKLKQAVGKIVTCGATIMLVQTSALQGLLLMRCSTHQNVQSLQFYRDAVGTNSCGQQLRTSLQSVRVSRLDLGLERIKRSFGDMTFVICRDLLRQLNYTRLQAVAKSSGTLCVL